MTKIPAKEFVVLSSPLILLLAAAGLFTPLSKAPTTVFSHAELIAISPVRGTYGSNEPDTAINVYVKHTPSTLYERYTTRWFGCVLPAWFSLTDAKGWFYSKGNSGVYAGGDYVHSNRHGYFRFHPCGHQLYATRVMASLRVIPVSAGDITLNGGLEEQNHTYQTKVLVRQNGICKETVKLPLTAVYAR